jgi:hypothetical protein
MSSCFHDFIVAREANQTPRGITRQERGSIRPLAEARIVAVPGVHLAGGIAALGGAEELPVG